MPTHGLAPVDTRAVQVVALCAFCARVPHCRPLRNLYYDSAERFHITSSPTHRLISRKSVKLEQQTQPATELKTGTTTVGLVAKDCVVLASDQRATMGYLIANKTAKKIYKITDRIGATIAGSVADAQAMMDLLKAEAKLFEIERGKPIRVKALTKLLSNILFQGRGMYLLQCLVGGFDEEGPQVFYTDFIGSVLPDKFTATGSGSPYALGVLESGYKDDLPKKKAIELAVRAVAAAIERDAASGNSILVSVIDKEGYQEVDRDTILKIWKGE
ncbi:MAG: archaeal proteasome endopeptidase complex subunit beta [Candidatus Thorarchaeota archaeon]|nr:archaeal proteasome endopeptidase complex subunit beta [Candidatus Thorarchaeota archaeon]